jgi:hypothetical protein
MQSGSSQNTVTSDGASSGTSSNTSGGNRSRFSLFPENHRHSIPFPGSFWSATAMIGPPRVQSDVRPDRELCRYCLPCATHGRTSSASRQPFPGQPPSFRGNERIRTIKYAIQGVLGDSRGIRLKHACRTRRKNGNGLS